MIRAYKTEINPTLEQIVKICRTIGVCRFVYNLFIATNRQRYKDGEKFLGANAFSKWLNNEYRMLHPENSWILEVSSKAVKRAIINAEGAFKKFFKTKKGFPQFKKKHKNDTGFYVPRNNKKDTEAQRHRIKIPTLGWVRLKEFGYIPAGFDVSSITVKVRAGRYFVTCLVDEEPVSTGAGSKSEGIGVDLGIKETAAVSNEQFFGNINKTPEIKKLKRRLKREQRKFSRKIQNRKKGKTAAEKFANLHKQSIKVQKAYYRLDCVRKDYINKLVSVLVKIKPESITIEDLNILGMMKNKHLSRAIAEQNFGYFRIKLAEKCKAWGIELRVADRFYPSSKRCSKCGSVKKDLKLSDRAYICQECGLKIDRDLNAAINLKHCEHYKVA